MKVPSTSRGNLKIWLWYEEAVSAKLPPKSVKIVFFLMFLWVGRVDFAPRGSGWAWCGPLEKFVVLK